LFNYRSEPEWWKEWYNESDICWFCNKKRNRSINRV
jgi:hypothetical protein